MTTKTRPMEILERKGIPYDVHEHAHDQYTAEGVAEDLGVPVAQVVKAMLVRCAANWFVLVVVPGDRRLSLEKVGAMVGTESVRLASRQSVQKITGYPVGAVSVMGFRRGGVLTYVDQRVLDLEQVIISSGRPDAGLALPPDAMMQALEGAQVGDFCEDE